jgi:hypothetical protein
MDGSMNLEQALEERLKLINCTPQDIKAFIRAHPPASRLAPVGGHGCCLGAGEAVARCLLDA